MKKHEKSAARRTPDNAPNGETHCGTRRRSRAALKNTLVSALFLSLGLILPFFTGQIKQFGNMLLPMHVPVMLCGFTCGPAYAFGVGLALPYLRFLTFGMPVLYPSAVAMSLELATYGVVCGILRCRRKFSPVRTYVALVCAMVAGRAVWGAAMTVLVGLGGNSYTFRAFAASAILNGIPGIVIQLVAVPLLTGLFFRLGVIRSGADE